MKIVREAAAAEFNCLGKQKYFSEKNYRTISYSMQIETEDGLLVYNNLTDELVLLEGCEQDDYNNCNIGSDTIKYLIEKWFFVPSDHVDVVLCNQLNSFMHMLYNSQNINKPITGYTIFPTTDCNARCFYCYELGRSRVHMTDKVANDTADFIIKSCKGNDVSIRWFGGEPLYNLGAIDIICKKLRDKGINFKTRMISNGYLFDEEIVKKATELWNLLQVQITLDGTEDIYNRCKAYIYDDVSPFKRVIANIKLLLDAGIRVKVRMNVDDYNIKDLYLLTDFLYQNFASYSNFNLYSRLLFDDTESIKGRSQQEKELLQKAHSDLSRYIKSKGFETKYTLDNYLRYMQCMADNPSTTTILPDGHLGKCEHFSDSYFWGSIYDQKIDYDVINLFKKIRVLPPKCDDCPIRPACIQLEMCSDLPKECTNMIKASYISNTKNRILNTYIEYKTGIKQDSNIWK